VDSPVLSAPVAGRPDRILIAGTARSGTSWCGRVLARAEGVRYYHEPDNVDADTSRPELAGRRGFGPYPFVDATNEAAFAPLWDAVWSGRLPRMRGWKLRAGRAALRMPRAVRDPLTRRYASVASRLPGGPKRTVVKSIYSAFAVEWLVARYQPRVIAVQRNPLNVVSSWRQLGLHGFDLGERPAVRERVLDRLGLRPPSPLLSELGRLAWAVGLLTTVLGEAAARHPEWLLLTHEDLCVDPPARFREVFDRLGLPWSAEVARFLAESDRPGEGFVEVRVAAEQPDRWRKRLSDAEVDEVSEVLRAFPQRGWLRAPAGAVV
jgi:hypothetical protein